MELVRGEELGVLAKGSRPVTTGNQAAQRGQLCPGPSWMRDFSLFPESGGSVWGGSHEHSVAPDKRLGENPLFPWYKSWCRENSEEGPGGDSLMKHPSPG